VLLVEDELGVRGLVARILGDLGYTVLEAGDGESERGQKAVGSRQ
jgi:CheY-like chemotaxis protein